MIESMKYRLNYDDGSENLSVTFDKEYESTAKYITIRENGCKMVEIDVNYIGWLIQYLKNIKGLYYESE